jgi:hypothetical protein
MSDQSRTPVEDRPDTPAEDERGGVEARRHEPGATPEEGARPAGAGTSGAPDEAEEDADLFAPLPDDLNPAIIDARKAYIITMLGSVLFCGAVIVFLLL